MVFISQGNKFDSSHFVQGTTDYGCIIIASLFDDARYLRSSMPPLSTTFSSLYLYWNRMENKNKRLVETHGIDYRETNNARETNFFLPSCGNSVPSAFNLMR